MDDGPFLIPMTLVSWCLGGESGEAYQLALGDQLQNEVSLLHVKFCGALPGTKPGSLPTDAVRNAFLSRHRNGTGVLFAAIL
jgi:hypothetical protein